MTNTIYTSLENRKQKFINKSNIKHKFLYEYIGDYIDAKTKFEIVCPIHGSFFQIPTSHSSGIGCPKCGKIKKANSKTKTKQQFINDAINVHGNTYDYSKVEYINSTTKIKIICKHHGIFKQTPEGHLKYKGCRQCSNERKTFVTKKDSYTSMDICVLYTVRITGNGEIFYKTGISNDINNRFNNIINNYHYIIEIIDTIIDTRYNCVQLEKKLLLKRQRIYKYIPSIKFDGWTECYTKQLL